MINTVAGRARQRLAPICFWAAYLALSWAAVAQGPPASSARREPWMDLPPSSTGVAIGQKIPAFQLRDQFGRLQDFDSIRGPKGAAIFFNRSADW